MDLKIEQLKEVLPYIEAYKDKVFVIKYGGSIMHSKIDQLGFIDDVAFLKRLGIKIVIVHGGGQFISKRLESLKIPSSFEEGYRVTDEKMIKEVEMLLSGGINKELTLLFNNKGVEAVGMNGKDGGMIMSKRKIIKKDNHSLDIGFVGEIEKVDPSYLKILLENGYLPVIAPIGFDKSGVTYNLNADDVASKICTALGGEKLILMTDVKGLYKEFGNEKSFIPKLGREEAQRLMDYGIIKGGMLPKLKSCITSLEEGAGSVHIISGMVKHALLKALLTDEGMGTLVE